MESLASVDVSAASIIAGVVIANVTAIIGFFWSLSKKQVVHDMQIEQLQKDVNNLGQKVRQ